MEGRAAREGDAQFSDYELQKVLESVRESTIKINAAAVLTKLEPLCRNYRNTLRGCDDNGNITDNVTGVIIREIATAQWIEVVRSTVFQLSVVKLEEFISEKADEKIRICFDRAFASNIIPQLEGILSGNLIRLGDKLGDDNLNESYVGVQRLIESEKLI